MTPLLVTSWHGHATVGRTLLGFGASVNQGRTVTIYSRFQTDDWGRCASRSSEWLFSMLVCNHSGYWSNTVAACHLERAS